ncbi:MAG TPA: alpha/beta hydrolase [Treponemataceae bacterium]|nr:alpha/beta hydrolase [Treponemataceae bacterium]
MSNWKQSNIVVGDVTLHYTRTGGNKPPLVLIHGFSDNGLCWTPVARELESVYDIIMPDMPSHGKSSRIAEDQEIDMAANVAQLIQALQLGKPIVGGHSMGAVVTYELAARFPHLVKAFFLEDPAWMMEAPVMTPEMAKNNPMGDWVKKLPSQTLEELLRDYKRDHPAWSDELVQHMAEAKKQLDVSIFEKLTLKLFSQEWNWKTTLQDVKQKALLFTADNKKGAVVSKEAAAKAKELKPDLTIVYVPDAGHLIRFDALSIFIKELKAFLAPLS